MIIRGKRPESRIGVNKEIVAFKTPRIWLLSNEKVPLVHQSNKLIQLLSLNKNSVSDKFAGSSKLSISKYFP